jgi:hypothetical protein
MVGVSALQSWGVGLYEDRQKNKSNRQQWDKFVQSFLKLDGFMLCKYA